MDRVWVWIERQDGQVERHIGPFERYVRDKEGRTVSTIVDGRPKPVYDEKYVAAVMKQVGGFEGQNAYDVARSLDPDQIKADKTGVLERVAAGLLEVAERVVERQRRAERRVQRVKMDGSVSEEPQLRALWLVDMEFAGMKVRVRAE